MKKKRRQPAELMSALDHARAASSDMQIRTLVHELQVYSEEVTVQNEQLLKAQTELEEARDRFADLYDFAPIGYFSLSARGAIVETNLAGATLLGRPRHYLINAPLAAFIDKDDRQRFREFLRRSLSFEDGIAPQAEVMIRNDPDRIVRLMARPLKRKADHVGHVFTAMIDVTEERRLENERKLGFEREQRKSAELAKEVTVRLSAEERVKALLVRLIGVQEQERRRLALNLHDQLGQQLTALQLTIGALKESTLPSEEADKRFTLMEQIVSQLDRDVDFLAWELRPAALDDVGLDAALREFLRQWSLAQGVEAEFHASVGNPRLPPEIESHLYRIVQEALNNVSKHAHAAHVSVLLERRGEAITLIVEDDGRGFDADTLRGSVEHGGMGLVGMQERVSSVGGQMQYESTPGEGAAIFVRIPLGEG